MMMSDESILVETRGHVGLISLNRPEQFNTFDRSLAEGLCRILEEMDRREEVRVVVVNGTGKAFCTGIDLKDFFGKSLPEYREWIRAMERVFLVIAGMKRPVIVSAQGYAVANGVGLLAAADLAIVAEGTKIGATAVNVGLFCMGPAVPLSRSLGRKRCLELLMTGDLIDAEEAERWGLVNRVVPKDRLEEETMALAEKLASKSPVALQMGKQAFYGMSDLEFAKALEYTNEVFASLCMTEDAQEGVLAFLEKRKPVWKGR